jgi:hypothetical protein
MRGHWFSILACVLFASTAGCSSEDANSLPADNIAAPEGESASKVLDTFVVEADFTPLSLNDFHTFPQPKTTQQPTWSATGNVLNCSGTPRGYLYSRKSYRNFTLRLEYRFPPSSAKRGERSQSKSNTGFLIYMPDEHTLWPASLEVQGRHDEMGQIKSNSRDVDVTVRDDEQARVAARKLVGKWNEIEIVSRDGTLVSYVNGTKICESDPGELTAGFIGLQSEDFAVQFRRLRIREE